MSLIQMFVSHEAAHDTLHELGDVGSLQFKDLNTEKSAFQRLFVQDVRKCDDMLRILRFVTEMLAKEKISLKPHGDTSQAPPSLTELHDKLIDLEKEMKEHNASANLLLRQKTELEEHQFVLRKASQWFAYGTGRSSFTAPTAEGAGDVGSLLDDPEAAQTKQRKMLGHIAGCIPFANLKDFALTLFRATRGNMLLKHEEIGEVLDASKGEMVQKSVFIVFFSGERSKVKIDKICDAYGANKYALPDNGQQQGEILSQVEERLRDLSLVIDKTDDYRRSKLEGVCDSVAPWTLHVQKEKAVYHTLNKFNYDVTHKCLIAEGWAPVDDMDSIREALRKGTAKSGASVQTVLNVVKTRETPPTYFRTTKFTKGTQSIVDAYGTARYQEFNPAVFSVITFPFLFGVMFGDIGHGIMMALAGGLLCYFEKQLAHLAADEMFGTLYKGRYNILLMGIFATYSGFIYNELFAVPSEMFGNTVWCSGENTHDAECMAVPGQNPGGFQKWQRTNLKDAWNNVTGSTGEEVTWDVYPFGTDPGFAHTGNKLNSVNSFKMKFAIIAGVTQMVAGVCCKLMNTLYFKDTLTMYFVFIPEMVFINSIFGYLCILIMTKWTTNWDATFVLNNDAVVGVPQVYCMNDLSNVPCWTPPYIDDKMHVLGGKLASLPEHMWCMKGGVPTAGCAVIEIMRNGVKQLIVESNTFGTKELMDPLFYSKASCDEDLSKCVLWKQNPPSLLDSLIKMFMEIGDVPVANQVVGGQGGLQVFLIFIAFVSVPMLLFPKPLILKKMHENKAAFQTLEDEGEGHGGGGHGHGHGEFDFGEEMVHQMIHTIEYVLGCISNTASYLRLWALSLAHAQLSEVFWEKTVVEIGVESADPVMLFVTISAWACFTVGVLMGMESLSAFLHALRLHWVEFMNKFYGGDGYKFVPFSFETMNDVVEGGAAE